MTSEQNRGATSWDEVVTAGVALPEVQESTSYRTPALKVAGSLMARLRNDDDGAVMFRCAAEEKAAFLAEGEPFFTTAHYDGHDSVLVRLEQLPPDRLAELVEGAWWVAAPSRLRAAGTGR
ncbi:MmcQ/YjbR family DNA-binding protein [Nakamurella flavida]|uniref:MmcQ/YjbR family DNA-binding protein n=1 Tax=Nakamurella flavida TaxID=363630 RepID=A0A938YKI6_9ACTN|nr:MmcQ/YjbR family DNA-binding protein [Nakamurella flavida]MBM9475122.1 MmcQ/YjbR family DNA-binding protein [Nakamurella flavida]MDP9776692.1 hypothetical protein [Nakamurella flavida]